MLTNFETFSPVVVKDTVRTTLSTVPMGYELGILLEFELNSNFCRLSKVWKYVGPGIEVVVLYFTLGEFKTRWQQKNNKFKFELCFEIFAES